MLLALAFAAGFHWCVATSAHQIEGGDELSDWWRWEQTPGHIKNGDRSGAADDHWHRVAGDTALIKDLGADTYRFSLEWAKLEPQPGVWDEAVAAHYREELAALAAAGIAPMVTLVHFSLPAWAADQGGWDWPEIPEAFARFAARAQAEIGPTVRDWITLNEPTAVLYLGYVTGTFPPGKTDANALKVPAKNLLRAHALAYHALHAQNAAVRVGIAHHLRLFDAANALNPLDVIMAQRLEASFTWSFPDAVESGELDIAVPFAKRVAESLPEAAQTQDFVGINYYSRDRVRFVAKPPLFHEIVPPSGVPVSDLGWEIYPEGLYRVVKEVARRYAGRPIFITENGLADAHDAQRASFLGDHLAQLERAAAEGAPVEGYCHWSLLDNFEWAEGFAPRFGLYEVDYATQRRTARPSAAVFADHIRRNSGRGP